MFLSGASQNDDKPKRRQSKRRHAETTTNQNGDKLKRRQDLESSFDDNESASSSSPISATGSSEFSVHPTGSQKGKALLIEQSEYSYVVDRMRKAPHIKGAQYGARVTTVRRR